MEQKKKEYISLAIKIYKELLKKYTFGKSKFKENLKKYYKYSIQFFEVKGNKSWRLKVDNSLKLMIMKDLVRKLHGEKGIVCSEFGQIFRKELRKRGVKCKRVIIRSVEGKIKLKDKMILVTVNHDGTLVNGKIFYSIDYEKPYRIKKIGNEYFAFFKSSPTC